MDHPSQSPMFTVLVTTVLSAVVTTLLVYTLLQQEVRLEPVAVQPPAVTEVKTEEVKKMPTEEVLPASILSEKIPGGSVHEGFELNDGSLPSYNTGKDGSIYIPHEIYGKLLVNGENLNNGTVIPHPTNPQQVFISTYAFPENKKDILPVVAKNSIYLYDSEEFSIKKIFSQESNYSYNLIGIDGSNLIIWTHLFETGWGPCSSVWSLPEYVKSLDLTDLQKELQPYSIPKNILDKSKKEETACEKNM